MLGLRYPDLQVAFDADVSAFNRSNAYVIEGRARELEAELRRMRGQ